MFMATARIDAVWVHDGLLDARDYKTGRLWHDRVADVPGREGAGVRARAGRAQRAASGCGCATSTCSADVDDDPEPWEPDADDLAAIEEELRAAVERMRTHDDWTGVADDDVCRTARTGRSAATAPRAAKPAWPVLRTRRRSAD